MKLEGAFSVRQPPEAVYAFLVDPARFGKALRDLDSLTVVDDTRFVANLRVGISFIRGVLPMQFELVERQAPVSAVYRGKGVGMESFVEVTAGFRLSPAPGGATEVQWSGESQVGGRLMALGGGLLLPLARRNAAAFADALKVALEEQA